ncbi:hypothetical protein ACUHMQ_20380 [Chitinimonas sp. PSY-7]|uniref:hypothetical protein n=1 Tax=Chitinimonas sp. PSY-7 TaxID=3459088 RepID=UPI004040133D
MLITTFSSKPSQTFDCKSSEAGHQQTKTELYDELLGKYDVKICTTENSDKKSLDYFNSKKHEITYFDKKYGDIKLIVSGNGRCEEIKLFKSGHEIDAHEYVKKHILSMNGTFSHDEMHILEGMISENNCNKKEVLPYVELNENEKKNGASTSSKELKELIDFRLKRNPTAKEIIIPVLANKDHWYAVHLEIDKDGNKVKPTIINTTNEAKIKKSQDEILDGYRQVQLLLREVLNTSKSFSVISVDGFRFCQSLQYGNMGCGITTSLNAQALLTGEMKVDKLTFTKDSFRTEEQVLESTNVDIFHEGKKYNFIGEKAKLVKLFTEFSGTDSIPARMLTQEHYCEEDFRNDVDDFFAASLDTKKVELNINTQPYLIKDNSQRSNVILESIRRADLALNYTDRMERKNAVLMEMMQSEGFARLRISTT